MERAGEDGGPPQAPDGNAFPSDAYVFCDEIGRRVKSLRTAWNRAARAAGLKGFQLRDLRHEAGSRFDEAGVPISYVSKLLGHTNLSTTSRYLNIHRRGLQAAMQKARRASASRCTGVAQICRGHTSLRAQSRRPPRRQVSQFQLIRLVRKERFELSRSCERQPLKLKRDKAIESRPWKTRVGLLIAEPISVERGALRQPCCTTVAHDNGSSALGRSRPRARADGRRRVAAGARGGTSARRQREYVPEGAPQFRTIENRGTRITSVERLTCRLTSRVPVRSTVCTSSCYRNGRDHCARSEERLRVE